MLDPKRRRRWLGSHLLFRQSNSKPLRQRAGHLLVCEIDRVIDAIGVAERESLACRESRRARAYVVIDSVLTDEIVPARGTGGPLLGRV